MSKYKLSFLAFIPVMFLAILWLAIVATQLLICWLILPEALDPVGLHDEWSFALVGHWVMTPPLLLKFLDDTGYHNAMRYLGLLAAIVGVMVLAVVSVNLTSDTRWFLGDSSMIGVNGQIASIMLCQQLASMSCLALLISRIRRCLDAVSVDVCKDV